MLQQYGWRLWTGYIFLRIGICGGKFEHGNETWSHLK
jgi:hypothetical protein